MLASDPRTVPAPAIRFSPDARTKLSASGPNVDRDNLTRSGLMILNGFRAIPAGCAEF